jgi:hypothetical protein
MGFLSWFTERTSGERSTWLSRWVFLRPGRDDPKIDEIQQAAAADVAAMEAEDRKYFRQDGPGDQEDDL